jgi:hypothetical protein
MRQASYPESLASMFSGSVAKNENLGGSASGNHVCDSSLGFLNGDPLSASETNVVVSGQMTGIMRFRETGLLAYA